MRRANENDRSVPVFTHDCDRCFFLGTVRTKKNDGDGDDVWDLWWCPRPPGVTGFAGADASSVICRYGSNGSEYSASLPPECMAGPEQFIEMMKRYERPYVFAMARAVKTGLYNGPWKGHFMDAG